MSLLFNVLFAWKCKSTHHKIALDALRQLERDDAGDWTNLFLKNIEPYLEGAKAPDDRFKDFRNHVLHVKENHWGGATAAANQWYRMTVESLRANDWSAAVYRAGVLSHYYTDPIQPLHTAQSDKEGDIHRACEWSIAQSYDALRELLVTELGGFPQIKAPAGGDWLAQMVKEGAEAARPHYETMLERYDIHRGIKDPPAGLDRTLRVCVAQLLGHAVSGFARILERGIDEARVSPPAVSLTLNGVLSSLSIPIYWVTKKMAAAEERAQVEATYRELQQSGFVRETLSEDDRTIRQLHAEEVLKTTVAALNAQQSSSAKSRPAGDTAPASAPAPVPLKPVVEKPLPTPPRPAVVAAKPAVPAPATPKPKPAAESVPFKPPVTAKAPRELESEGNLPSSHSDAPPRRDSDSSSFVAFPPRETAAEGNESKGEGKPTADAAPPATSVATDPFKASPKETPALTEPARTVETAPPAPVEAKQKLPAPSKGHFGRFHLELDSPVVDAPSIGPKTADRLRSAGIQTVEDFLNADVETIAARLNQKHLSSEVLEEWKRQACLMIQIPGLRGHDAQILVACGIADPEELTAARPEDLLDLSDSFCTSPDGERALRGSPPPDLDEIQDWIIAATQARPLHDSLTKAA